MSGDSLDSDLLTVTVCNYWLKQFNIIERHLDESGRQAADAIHDLRVAARRCQSVAEACKPYLPAGWTRPIGQVLKPLRKACDQVRDTEVLLDWLTSLPEPQLVTAGLLNALRQQHADALLDLNKTIIKKKLKSQIHSLCNDILNKSAQTEPGTYQLEDTAAALLTARMAQITIYHHSVDRASGPDAVAKELHQLRIAGKQFRYVLEMLQPALNNSAGVLLERFIHFQDSLGALHDRLRFSMMLKTLAENSTLLKTMPEQIFTSLDNELARQKQLCWQDFHQLWKDMTAAQLTRDILLTLTRPGG
ncbi:MAG TPA: hypothetical protein DCM45_07390 [Clostridiales bacterium]|nr:hypothetical protein [Clostridiales bacterium]